MSEPVGETPVAVYELSGTDTRNGLLILAAIIVLGAVLFVALLAREQFKNAAVVAVILTVLAALAFSGFKRYKAKIKYWFTNEEFVKEEGGSRTMHSLVDLTQIKWSMVGAGESATGSYKVTFRDGTTYWFHADGRSGTFVSKLSNTSGVVTS